MYRVFIGYDSREEEMAQMCWRSIRQNSSALLDIQFLDLSQLKEVYGYKHDPDRPSSTDFTYTRFLIPYILGYRGSPVLFMDCDMIVYGDIAELWDFSMGGYAIRCIQHSEKSLECLSREGTKMDGCKQVFYPRKLWSAFMMLNPGKLGRWSKNYVETASGKELHRFDGIPDGEIGQLPAEWHDVDRITNRTQCFHWTEGYPGFCQGDPREADAWNEAREKYSPRSIGQSVQSEG